MSRKMVRPGARSSRGGRRTSNSERFEKVLFEEIQRLVREEAADPALQGARLVSLELSVDRGHARLAYVVEGLLAEEEQIERSSRQAFARAAGFFRARLAATLDLERLPTLGFTFVGVEVREAADPREGGYPWRD